jgi:peptide deformylase
MILKVARLGHPVLRRAADSVSADLIKTAEFQRLLDDMVETMREYAGVGLAAPQVHVSLQVAVLECESNPRYPDMPSVPLTYLVNPQLTMLEGETVEDYEGCLSIPELRGLVPRASELRVVALGRKGEPLDLIATGFHARIIQHEADHLNGDVYLDRMRGMRSLAYAEELRRFGIAELAPRK